MTSQHDTPRVTAVRVMLGPRSDWLKLQLPASAEVAVLGWIQAAPSVDAGVPAEIALLLSRALTRCFRLTFIDPENEGASAAWSARGDRWVRSVPAAGWASLFRSKDLPLVSTCDPEVARLLFEGGAWSMEAQTVLLSTPGEAPPGIGSGVLENLLQRRQLDEDVPAQAAELRGIMVPGPDGDFAQLVSLHREALPALLKHLEDEAKAAGLDFRLVTPEVFEQTRWFIEKVEQ